VSVPFVPVVNFWSTQKSISLNDLRKALTNAEPGAAAEIVVPLSDGDALAQALGVARLGRVDAQTPDYIKKAVHDGALGLLRASDVSPDVRALAIDGVDLFGENRITDISQWPLVASVPSDVTWDQSKSWTLVSAGDIMGDRGVRDAVEASGKGPSYLLDGGTSQVDRIKCCSYFGYQYPVVSRTGNAGAVRDFITKADFAMANLETGILPNAPYHGPTEFTFTTDPSYLEVVKEFGFDLLSNANNHSKNGGAKALSTAISTLDSLGILHAGAGVGPEAAAQPVITDINGTKVAIIACDAVNPGYWARPGQVGTNSCKNGSVSQTIRQIRDQVDAIVVFPHWGIEYERPVGYQFDLAREWFDAGADMIIGAHNHFPGGIYDYNGKVAMLSMGNFIFDQNFRQTTLQGLVTETTWNGGKPVQIWVHPLLNVDAQPNFAEQEPDIVWVYDVMKWQSKVAGLDWGGTPAPNFGNTPPK
jgi:poly-gamma-glutamate synthesis protein (capsule biosynthesis protein)